MTVIYYECGEPRTAYRIDNVSQKVLVYLSAYGPTTLQAMGDSVGSNSKEALQARINGYIGPKAANLVTQTDTRQQTIDHSDPPIEYDVTDQGDRFVRENNEILSMPADFEELVNTIAGVRDDLKNTQKSMHQLDANEFKDQLSDIIHRLEAHRERLQHYQ